MIKKIAVTYSRCAAFALLFLMTSALGWAQKKKIEIVHSNSLEFDESSGIKAKRLIGDVALRHNDVLMYCDSAYFYSETNTVNAYGHVKIIQGDSLTLRGDSLVYNGNTKLAKVRGNITMDNGDMILTTRHLDYNRTANTAYYQGGGHIVNHKDNNTLDSRIGYFYPESNTFFFKENVVMHSKEYNITSDTLKYNTSSETTYFIGPTNIVSDSSSIYCEWGWYNGKSGDSRFVKNADVISKAQHIKGDTIDYNKTTNAGLITGHAMIADTTEKLEVYGDIAYYNNADSTSWITGHVMMIKDFEGDSLYLHGDSLYSLFDSNKKRLIVTHRHVKFYKSDFQGKCDSLVFSDADSLMKMFYSPVIWSENNQITADYIQLRNANGSIEQMEMQQNAFIISDEDSTHFNQIAGNNMIGHFEKNALKSIDVKGNGQTVYYIAENDSVISQVNKADCENLIIRLDSSKVEKIVFLNKPKGTMYPLDQVKLEEINLKGFTWLEHLRPLQPNDVFIWDAHTVALDDIEAETDEDSPESKKQKQKRKKRGKK